MRNWLDFRDSWYAQHSGFHKMANANSHTEISPKHSPRQISGNLVNSCFYGRSMMRLFKGLPVGYGRCLRSVNGKVGETAPLYRIPPLYGWITLYNGYLLLGKGFDEAIDMGYSIEVGAW